MIPDTSPLTLKETVALNANWPGNGAMNCTVMVVVAPGASTAEPVTCPTKVPAPSSKMLMTTVTVTVKLLGLVTMALNLCPWTGPTSSWNLKCLLRNGAWSTVTV